MKFARILSLLLVILAVWWSYKSLMPSYKSGQTYSESEFSTDNALVHVENLSQEPHGVGFPGHENVKSYVISELKKLGLQTNIQEGYALGDWGNLSGATNIMARIKGTENGKALLLMSHYDSSPHSSLGASDAGSGVATILEGVRAFLAKGQKPKNDIIVLLTDAEELGLNGAELFVNQHPWAKDVGLVLNFEARGSGGPSYMLIETNRGNGKLVKEFAKANPEYVVGNSLAYSIYKMLPNDTDLTVFREDGDIDGFNFAFIGDHFDYHTALDNYERLDRESLAHQGSYLMPLLSYFSENDIKDLKSLDDFVYFNIPFFNIVVYPFEWIWPLFGLAVIVFLVLIVVGFRKKVLDITSILKGFIPLLIALLIAGPIGYVAWPMLKWWYPGYNDMLHGFTYNGYAYILAFALFALAVCFWSYHLFKKIDAPNLLVAPAFIWLIICGLASLYLPGANFFIIPLFGLLVALYVYINQKEPNPFLMVFLGLPAILIYAPFIKMFPVGLGLKMLVASTVFVVLLFLLLLPLFVQLKNKVGFAILFLFLFAIFSVAAHINSGFSESSPKPSSLLYVYDQDNNKAMWATYDEKLIGWNSQFLETDKKISENNNNQTISSKYSTGFSYTAEAQVKKISLPDIEVSNDTIIDGERILEVCITPNRNVNRLDVFTNDIQISKAALNGQTMSDHYLKNRRNGKLVTHFISKNDYTEIALSLPLDQKLELSFYESSNDLLQNNLFSVPQRPDMSIPMPFVLNDAIMTFKTLSFD